MFERVLKTKDGGLSTAKTLSAVVAIAFLIALLFMGLQAMVLRAGLISESQRIISVSVVSAILLAVTLAAAVYFLVIVPFTRHYEGRLKHETMIDDLRQSSITDPLTRTLNRRGITIGLFDLMALADRYNHQLSIAMVDVDRLKQINQEYGRKAGDQVLASVAGILAEALRMPDRVGRYSANEFLLILPETPLSAACKLTERIRTNTAQTDIDVDGRQVKTTISIGVTPFRKGEDLEHLISRAEQAIREAKAQGRNCVVCNEAP